MRKFDSHLNWVWPVLLLVSVIGACTLVFADIQTALRPFWVAWFLVVCPGMAYVRLLNIEESLTEWILAAALSLALDTAVSLGVLYAARWSTNWVFGALAVITTGGVALQIWRVRSTSDPSDFGGDLADDAP